MPKHKPRGQGALFGDPDVPEPSPTPTWDGPRPWDPIDAADEQLGWLRRWVTPARAREIRAEVESSRRTVP